mgnify:CR=1 FL=1
MSMKSLKQVIIGVSTAVFIILGAAGLLSKVVVRGLLGESTVELILTVLITVAILIGNTIAVKMSEGKYMVITCIYISVILGLLLLCGLFTEGNFRNVGIRLCSVGVGGLISYVLCQRRTGNARKKKGRYR